jgi:formate hydrogenlyase subunit 3/multisubunit Na+/H+ antiporter MnhD subunit
MGTAAGLTGGLLHLFNHALMKAALFMGIGAMALSVKAVKLTDFSGAALSAPWTMAAFAVAGFSLMGVPLTAGFLSKWRLIEAAISAEWWWAVGVIAVSSLLARLCWADAGSDGVPRARSRAAPFQGSADRRTHPVVDAGAGQRVVWRRCIHS